MEKAFCIPKTVPIQIDSSKQIYIDLTENQFTSAPIQIPQEINEEITLPRIQSKSQTSCGLLQYFEKQIKEWNRREPECQTFKRKKSSLSHQKTIDGQYSKFAFLTNSVLTRIQNEVKNYDLKFKNKKERVQLMRHNNKKEIFKFLLIGVEELRIKSQEMKSQISEFENDVLDKNTDLFRFSSMVASEIEAGLYKELYTVQKQPKYHQKLKFIKFNLKDPSNFALRRRFITRNFPIKLLAYCKEQELQSQERKLQQMRNMQYILNESTIGVKEQKMDQQIDYFQKPPEFQDFRMMEEQKNDQPPIKQKQTLSPLALKCIELNEIADSYYAKWMQRLQQDLKDDSLSILLGNLKDTRVGL